MNCPHCTTSNDTDALFCAECGKRLTDGPGTPVRGQRRQYFLALLFVPVIILAAAIGYYKFILPDGIAAVVNGEKIALSELDAAVARMKGAGGEAPAGMRFQALNELISERLALQEAGRAGIAVSKEETATAVRNAQAASGLDDAAFTTEMKALYGSARNFEKAMERSLIINRFLTERVIPRGADPGTAAQAVNRWLQDLSGKASVRIALAENLSGPGCGCGGKKGVRLPRAAKGLIGNAKRGKAGLRHPKEQRQRRMQAFGTGMRNTDKTQSPRDCGISGAMSRLILFRTKRSSAPSDTRTATLQKCDEQGKTISFNEEYAEIKEKENI